MYLQTKNRQNFAKIYETPIHQNVLPPIERQWSSTNHLQGFSLWIRRRGQKAVASGIETGPANPGSSSFSCEGRPANHRRRRHVLLSNTNCFRLCQIHQRLRTRGARPRNRDSKHLPDKTTGQFLARSISPSKNFWTGAALS